jgi:crotonobetainyl-CoA:carnitine CoA-transferase CaiB-like acyl-CoA transferase
VTDDLLAGFHVVTTAINVPGPVAAARLRDLGTRVTKVEPPSGDPLSSISPAWYAKLATGQEVVTLDLKTAAGRVTLDGLLAGADVVLTASRPAALERLGLNWDSVHARFPKLCHVAIIGFPAPRENESGHDLTYQAGLGLLQPPRMPVTLLADLAGAERAASAAVALLLNRERTGEAGRRWVSLAESAELFADPQRYGVTTPGSILGGGLPGYGVYKARDGYVAVAALEAHFLERLEEALELRPATHEAFEAVFQTRSAAEWEAWGKVRDIPIAAIR